MQRWARLSRWARLPRRPTIALASFLIVVTLAVFPPTAGALSTGVRFINSEVPYGGILPECADSGVDVGNDGATGKTYATYSYGGICNNWNPRPADFMRVRVKLSNTGVVLDTSPWVYNTSNQVTVSATLLSCNNGNNTCHSHGRSESGYLWQYSPGKLKYRAGSASINI